MTQEKHLKLVPDERPAIRTTDIAISFDAAGSVDEKTLRLLGGGVRLTVDGYKSDVVLFMPNVIASIILGTLTSHDKSWTAGNESHIEFLDIILADVKNQIIKNPKVVNYEEGDCDGDQTNE